MKIEIIGTGCASCDQLEHNARAVAARLELPCEITHVRDIAKFATYGVMVTPALVVDGVVVAAGKVPSEAALTELLEGVATRPGAPRGTPPADRCRA